MSVTCTSPIRHSSRELCVQNFRSQNFTRINPSPRCTACAARAVPAERRAVLGALALGGIAACGQPVQAAEVQTCYMDISVEGEVLGRVVIGLLDPPSLSARRFSDLCKGIQGVSYKRSKFDAIFAVCLLSEPCLFALPVHQPNCVVSYSFFKIMLVKW